MARRLRVLIGLWRRPIRAFDTVWYNEVGEA
jgi:hypothetical protein